jgi:hypothetical protein
MMKEFGQTFVKESENERPRLQILDFQNEPELFSLANPAMVQNGLHGQSCNPAIFSIRVQQFVLG